MQEYIIYKLNNFIVVHFSDSLNSYVYDYKYDIYLEDFDDIDDEYKKNLDRLFAGKDIDFFEEVEMKIEAVYSDIIKSYLDNKSIIFYKKSIRYMVRNYDIDGLYSYLKKIEDDYYPYLYIYTVKKLIEDGISPYKLKGKLKDDKNTSDLVMALSLSLIGQELNDYFSFFKDKFKFSEKYLQVIEMKNLDIIKQFTDYAGEWAFFLEEFANMQKSENKKEAIYKYFNKLISDIEDLSYEDYEYINSYKIDEMFSSYHGNVVFKDLIEKFIDQDYEELYSCLYNLYTSILDSTYKKSEYRLIGEELSEIRRVYKMLYEDLNKNLRERYKKRPSFIKSLDEKIGLNN